jgi:flagellar protein FliO/FliZ
MNFEILGMFSQLILALGLTLGLMVLTFKLMGTKLDKINNNKYIKVMDKVQVTKENSILVVKIGDKGYVITSTSGNMEKLLELSEDEINKLEADKRKSAQDMSDAYNKFAIKLKKSFFTNIRNIRSKEEKHEKK